MDCFFRLLRARFITKSHLSSIDEVIETSNPDIVVLKFPSCLIFRGPSL